MNELRHVGVIMHVHGDALAFAHPQDGPGTLPLYPVVLYTTPGASSTLTGAMRSVRSGFASGSAATEENRGTEAKAAPTALTPVTAKNSLRFSMANLVSFRTGGVEMIVKRHNPTRFRPCQARII